MEAICELPEYGSLGVSPRPAYSVVRPASMPAGPVVPEQSRTTIPAGMSCIGPDGLRSFVLDPGEDPRLSKKERDRPVQSVCTS